MTNAAFSEAMDISGCFKSSQWSCDTAIPISSAYLNVQGQKGQLNGQKIIHEGYSTWTRVRKTRPDIFTTGVQQPDSHTKVQAKLEDYGQNISTIYH